MKILFLAPQPFFQERGTPIAVRLALEVLAARARDEVHLLTYHEGADVEIPFVHHHRIHIPRILRKILQGIGPGISWRKLVCDLLFAWQALRLVHAERAAPFQLVHAVEESAFIARLIKAVWKIPYIYDMDSSLAMQLTEKWWLLRPLRGFLDWWERLAVRDSLAVVPVCDALAAVAERHGSSDTHILRDISLLALPQHQGSHAALPPIDLRREIDALPDDVLILYIGNLEPYQGVELLIESFRTAVTTAPHGRVVIIGGAEHHIAQMRELVIHLGLSARVHLLGPRPIAHLRGYLEQADILVSPRVRGNNTPMKIYSYLHAGRAVLATDLPTHSQVLRPPFAKLAPATPQEFGRALAALVVDHQLRSELGMAARTHAEAHYTFEVFEQSLHTLYDRIERRVGGNSPPSSQLQENAAPSRTSSS